MTLCAVLPLLTSCASEQVVDRFDRVELGMGKDDVVAMLGPPSSSWPLTEKLDGVTGERLQWGDGLSSLASSAAFRGDPERAYSVVFGADGKVISKAVPTWVEQQAAEDAERRANRLERQSLE